MAKIGIPRALAYYIYFPFWKVFFETLGHEIVESSPTTRVIMDKGVKDTVSDACIPIKVYHGHVEDLIDRVDYIFVPRLVSLRKFGDYGTETLCPKFLGLPDMVKASVGGSLNMLETRIDLKKGRNELFKVYRELGKRLGAADLAIYKAFWRASRTQRKYEKLLQKGVVPEVAMERVFAAGPTGSGKNDNAGDNPLRLGVIGYPYAIYDQYINVGLLTMLDKAGVEVFTQDMLSPAQLKSQAVKLEKDLFWYFSNRAVQGALYYMDVKPVDGIIHITAFACGPDSIVDKYLEIEAKKRKIPYMSITIDEHTGEAGMQTRLEAFLDMLEYRRRKSEG
ncbi:MAG: acyl-CoA dehydratase activase-related protein [Syntrophomonadaceae bacterium]|nr:acyl-CoA dehydratase activase-related protein [Syntrophomonadaceae bacterium]